MKNESVQYDANERGRVHERVPVTVQWPAKPPLVNLVVWGNEKCLPRSCEENVFKEHFRHVENCDAGEEADEFQNDIHVRYGFGVTQGGCDLWGQHQSQVDDHVPERD